MKLTPGAREKTFGKEPRAVPATLRRWGVGDSQLWIGVVFSLCFLALALHDVDLTETANTLRRVNVPLLGAAVASFVLSAAAKSIRWQLLLAVRKSPSFARAFSVLSVGLMVNAFLPARLGEFGRAYLMGESEADSKAFVLGTIAIEKVADLLFLLLSLAVLLSQMALPEWLAGPARGTALVIAILVPCFVLLAWQSSFVLRVVEQASRFVPLRWREWLVGQTRYGLASLVVVRRPRRLIGLIGWSLIVWLLSALTNHLAFLALELAMPVWAPLLLLVVLQVGVAVPSSPGRIGVFQYLTILTLALFSIEKEVALGYSVVLYLVVYAPIAVLGAWGFGHEKITWGRLVEAAARFSESRKRG